MKEPFRLFTLRAGWAMILCLAAIAGCSPPSATLDLITVARTGLAGAKAEQAAQYELNLKQLNAQASALDSAFDADVKLAAAGQIKDPSGRPVPLSPEWVISARKGYSAARDVLAQQMRNSQNAHGVNLDNLKAADDALDMASQLILQQQGLAVKMQQQMINLQRKVSNGK